MPPADDSARKQLAELTAAVSDLTTVVAGLVRLSADETMPASRSGTEASRERAMFLRQATDVCQTVEAGLERLRQQLTD